MDNVKRKCQVILLPSLEKTNLILNESLKILNSGLTDLSVENNPHIKYQHLYILSDDEIKSGWNGIAYKKDIKNLILKHFYTENPWYKDTKIVIASTDKSLNLPQPSPQFVNKYCEEYNKGNQITNIMVDYFIDYEPGNKPSDRKYDTLCLTVDKNNYITITKLKEYYTLKEISNAFKLEGIYYTENFLYKLLNQ